MQRRSHYPLAMVCAIGFVLATTALAQDRNADHDHAGHAAQAASGPSGSDAAAASDLPMVDAEVRRVDTRNHKLSLRHQHIPNLDMPPMTMVFKVADPALLDGLKTGNQLKVTIDEIDGAYTVLSLEPAQP